MKKQRLFKLVALLVLCCVMFGCGKDESPTTRLGSVFGIVTDFGTGDPIANANVRLNPKGETTLTGSDGTFQFNGLIDGNYSLSLSKDGYADLDDDYVIAIEDGNEIRRDVQIRKNRIHVYGIVTDQFGEPQQNVEVGIYYIYQYIGSTGVSYGEHRIAIVTTLVDGSYDVMFDNYSESTQHLVRAKKYVNEVGHWCSSEEMYFNINNGQEFNINPILKIE